ncbi:MAG: sensor histidine kinase, partial [Planctomycetes bacterium]|nr:sensor histidine kinase [Planctomycetota bacterium]
MAANETYTPTVKESHAFREISRDFTKPAEIFREALANALDAYAQNIWLRASVEKRRGREVVIIDLADDGIGMTKSGIKSFLNLSDSEKPDLPPNGRIARRMTGYKGHGTKIYYNSDQLEVVTYNGAADPVYCCVHDPRGSLADDECPLAQIQDLTMEELTQRREEWGFSNLGSKAGTTIRILGYHGNSPLGLE